MRKTRDVLLTLTVGHFATLLVGCAVNPGELQITARDRQMYTDPTGGPLVQEMETKLPVAILVSQGGNDLDESIYQTLDSSLVSLISEFAFFTTVERSNLGALQQEHALETLDSDELGQINIPEADYLITAKIASAAMESSVISGGRFQGATAVDFRFYEKPTDRVVLTRHIEGKSPGYTEAQDGPEANASLAEAVREAAKAFAIEVGARYAPEARVIETRGDGQVAKISIGSNYGATKGTKIEFYEYVDNSDVVAGATRESSPVGYGKIHSTSNTTSWVEIQNYKKVNVLRGHYVKFASDQSKDAGDQLKGLIQ